MSSTRESHEAADATPAGAPVLPRLAGGDPRLRLLDLTVAEGTDALSAIVAELGAAPFRARQVQAAVWRRHARSFQPMSDLPPSLRTALEERVRLDLLDLVERSVASDGTVKYLWRLADGAEIESVAIPTRDRLTFCVSSQVGCSLHCRFCATGYLGLARNLTPGEIVDQVQAMLAAAPERPPGVNVVFMGMGEPGHNLPSVLRACTSLQDPAGLGIGARHITVSTSGVVPAIQQLAAQPLQVRLAVSLHSARQDKRSEIMDIAAKHPLEELLAACIAYHDATHRRITFEYTVLPGLNDSSEDAIELARFAGAVPSKVNLIPYNPIAEFPVRTPTPEAMDLFRRKLLQRFAGEAVVRTTRGRDIDAACGMLHRRRIGA